MRDEPSDRRVSSLYFGKLIASRPNRAGKALSAAALVSLSLHATLVGFAIWASLALGKDRELDVEEQITLFEVVEQEPPPLPPRPVPPLRPEPPPAPEPAPEEIEGPAEQPKGFQTLAEPKTVPTEIPPPGAIETDEGDFSGEGVEGGRAAGKSVEAEVAAPTEPEPEPRVTPFDVPPRLKNPREVSVAAQQLYPRVLRQAGVTGTVQLWMFLDNTGRLLNKKIRVSSGHDAFDEAALSLADVMEFEPAVYLGEPVAVWIIVPVQFVKE